MGWGGRGWGMGDWGGRGGVTGDLGEGVGMGGVMEGTWGGHGARWGRGGRVIRLIVFINSKFDPNPGTAVGLEARPPTPTPYF